MTNSTVSWDERFEYDVFLARIVEKDLTADDWSLARFDEALPKIRQLIANLNSFQLFSSQNTNGIPIVRFVLKSKRGRRIRPFNQNYLPLDKSVYEVDVLVRCSDERVEPMFMEYDPSANTLSTYQEASIRIQRKPDCEWGQLRDGWRVFSFVVCKGRQLQLTKAAHTVHRFISLVFPSQQGSRSSSCSPPLPQQQQGSSHCCCPPLPQHNEMEPLLTDTIRQLRREKEDLANVLQVLQEDRQHRDLLLAENLRLRERKNIL